MRDDWGWLKNSWKPIPVRLGLLGALFVLLPIVLLPFLLSGVESTAVLVGYGALPVAVGLVLALVAFNMRLFDPRQAIVTGVLTYAQPTALVIMWHRGWPSRTVGLGTLLLVGLNVAVVSLLVYAVPRLHDHARTNWSYAEVGVYPVPIVLVLVVVVMLVFAGSVAADGFVTDRTGTCDGDSGGIAGSLLVTSSADTAGKPSATFEGSRQNQSLRISHDAGEPINATALTIELRGGGSTRTVEWAAADATDNLSVTTGESVRLPVESAVTNAEVVWESRCTDSSAVLWSHGLGNRTG